MDFIVPEIFFDFPSVAVDIDGFAVVEFYDKCVVTEDFVEFYADNFSNGAVGPLALRVVGKEHYLCADFELEGGMCRVVFLWEFAGGV